MGVVRREGVPPRPGEALLEQLVGQLGLGHRRLALQILALGADLVEAAVDLGVHPADEEGSHAVDLGGVASAGHPRLEAAQVGLDDLGVPGQARR